MSKKMKEIKSVTEMDEIALNVLARQIGFGAQCEIVRGGMCRTDRETTMESVMEFQQIYTYGVEQIHKGDSKKYIDELLAWNEKFFPESPLGVNEE